MFRSLRRDTPSARGVNLFGYLRAESGVGEHSRTLLAALDEARIPTIPIAYGDTRSRQDHPLPPGAEDEPRFDCHLICVNADQTPNFVAHFGATRLGRAPRIGFWHWEVEEFPDWMAKSAEHVDAIWTASRHSAGAIRRKVDRPVVVMPPVVDPPPPAAVPAGIVPEGDGPLFLVCFDYDSVFDRKNPIGAILAYRRAFPRETGARLLVKSVNGAHYPEREIEVVLAADGRRDITIADGFLSRSEQEGLIHACDIFVSLHRAEGFGLMLAESMAAGKAVIATDYSGNLEFMKGETGVLVPWTYAEIATGTRPYSGRWAEPDIDFAAAAMARLAADPSARGELGARAARAIRDGHGVEARARDLVRELREPPAALVGAASVPGESSDTPFTRRWRTRHATLAAGRARRAARSRASPPASG
jgi:glycosyltransferase involved in cell wall biosynthesis